MQVSLKLYVRQITTLFMINWQFFIKEEQSKEGENIVEIVRPKFSFISLSVNVLYRRDQVRRDGMRRTNALLKL